MNGSSQGAETSPFSTSQGLSAGSSDAKRFQERAGKPQDVGIIAVVGLWHLGSVTAACMANAGFEVIAFDSESQVIQAFNEGKTPVYEPGLEALIEQAQRARKLVFTNHANDIASADLVWITFDTPVDEQDVADVDFVRTKVMQLLPYIKHGATILISSQVPVRTTRSLLQFDNQHYPDKHHTFAYSPENLRLGKAIQVFQKPDRVVIGVSSDTDKQKLITLFQPFTQDLIWMTLESAEMTKHALNAFFATSVVFINELATLSEQVGADASEVEQGLKTEERIGPKAYLRAGAAIGGGTLARDVTFLNQLSQQYNLSTPLLSSILQSNANHKLWSCGRIKEVFPELRGKTVALLGLTYKVGTDTLRRSTAVEIGMWLHQQGACVIAYDPAIKSLPEYLCESIHLKSSLNDVLVKADALIIATECPEFLEMTSDQLISLMKHPHVFDAGGFLKKQCIKEKKIRYYTVGRSHEISGT